MNTRIQLLLGSICVIMFLLSITTYANLTGQTAQLWRAMTQDALHDCISSFSSSQAQDFTIAYRDLNADAHEDAIVQYTGGDACGSAGCIFELCMHANGSFTHVPFGIAGSEIIVAETITNGMRDVEIKNDQKDQRFKLYWNGASYDLDQE